MKLLSIEKKTKETPVPTARYLKYDGLKPIQVRAECRDCSGLCCVYAVPHISHWEIVRWRVKGLRPLLLTYHISRWTRHKSRVCRRYEEVSFNQKKVGLDQVYHGYVRQRAEACIKQAAGACVYWNRHTGKCQIYARRPASCKRWFCEKGEATIYLSTAWDEIQALERERKSKPCGLDHVSSSDVGVTTPRQEPLGAVESSEGS